MTYDDSADGVSGPAGDGAVVDTDTRTHDSGGTGVVVSSTTRLGDAGNRFLSQSAVRRTVTGPVAFATARVAATLALNR